MELYAPSYYKDFKCIADMCRHSCCVGWEIGVDEDTLCRYDTLPKCEREELLSHIKGGVIALSEGKRCPFLEPSGLCKIICRRGEEYTSEICREHPRFYNYLPDRVEVGLGASCEAAAGLIIGHDGYDCFALIGKRDGESFSGYDASAERSRIYSLLKDEKLKYGEKISKISEIYGIGKELFEKDRLMELLYGLEYLREEDRAKFCELALLNNRESFAFGERFFAYLIYRHTSTAESYESFKARLCMCICLLLLFESLTFKGTEPAEAARLISEEIEYSEDNTDSLIFEFECEI